MSSSWQVLETLARIENPWLTLIGERFRDETGKDLTYWRVERSDSVIVIPIYMQTFILPRQYYRPGVGKMTFDFPGGRHDPSHDLEHSAYRVLQKELQIEPEYVKDMAMLNPDGWNVDSSFSNQRVFVFEACISREIKLNYDLIETRLPTDSDGFQKLLSSLHCLQCRCALLEWMSRFK